MVSKISQVLEFDFKFAQHLNYIAHIFLLNISFVKHFHNNAVNFINFLLRGPSVKQVLVKVINLHFLTTFRNYLIMLTRCTTLLLSVSLSMKELILSLKCLKVILSWVYIFLFFGDLLLHLLQLFLRLNLFFFQVLLLCLTQVDVEQIIFLNFIQIVDQRLLRKMYLDVVITVLGSLQVNIVSIACALS